MNSTRGCAANASPCGSRHTFAWLAPYPGRWRIERGTKRGRTARGGGLPTRSGERPSVSWPVEPCPMRTTSPCDLRATWGLDFASPRPPARIEFDPRLCCQRFTMWLTPHVRLAGPSPASPPKSSPATRSPPRTTDHPAQADNTNPITQGGIPWQPEGCQGSPPPSRRAQVWGTLCTISKTPLSVQTFRPSLCLQTTTHLCHPTAQNFRPKPLPATLHPQTTSSNPIPKNKPLNLSPSRPVPPLPLAEFLKPVTHVSQPLRRHLCRLHLSRKTAQTCGNTLIANRFPRLGPASRTQPGFTG